MIEIVEEEKGEEGPVDNEVLRREVSVQMNIHRATKGYAGLLRRLIAFFKMENEATPRKTWHQNHQNPAQNSAARANPKRGITQQRIQNSAPCTKMEPKTAHLALK